MWLIEFMLRNQTKVMKKVALKDGATDLMSGFLFIPLESNH